MTNRVDNFNRSSGPIGTASDGISAWVEDSGTWVVDSNIRAAETTRGQQLICSLEASISDVAVEAPLSGGPGSTNPGGEVGLTSRVADDGNYILWLPDGRLFSKVGGGFAVIAGSPSTTVNPGDVLKLTSDSSNLHSGYINGGTAIITGTDASGATNTRHGLRRYNDTNQWYYDTFSITALGGGTQSYSYTAAGGIVFAGAAPKISKRVNTAAGGITFAGTAPYSSSGTQTRTVTPSGGITFAGAAAQILKRINTAAGGITFAGAAAQVLKRVNTAAGGITFVGAATQVLKRAVLASGGITFGGAATVSTHVAKLIVAAAGGIAFGGAAAVSYVGRIARDFIIRMRRRRL